MAASNEAEPDHLKIARAEGGADARALQEGDRELFTTAMPFLWHPYLYHCGTNARVPGEGPYTVRVRIEPAAFMRQDPINGKRYERPVEAVFEDRRFTPGRKPSRDAQPRGADSPDASG
jgi:hypothetical protein